MTATVAALTSSLLLLWTAIHLPGGTNGFQPLLSRQERHGTSLAAISANGFHPLASRQERHGVPTSLAAGGGFGTGTSSRGRTKKKNKRGFGGANEKNDQKQVESANENPNNSPPASPTGADIVAAYEATARGRDLQSKGALNAAIEAFTAALALHPTVDRQFNLAMALEENGEPQSAIDMYEQARQNDAADAILRHDVFLKLAHLWAHDLGDVEKGIGYVDKALAEEGYVHTPESNAVAWYQKAFFVADEGRLDEAIALWDSAIEAMEQTTSKDAKADSKDETDGESKKERFSMAKFYRSVARALLERNADVVEDAESAECQYLVDSWRYAVSHYPKELLESQPQGRVFSGTYTMLEEALQKARSDSGVVAEFGVFHGKSIRLISSMVGPEVPVDGFDTFTGIPEIWGDEPAGSYTANEEIPQRVPDNVRFHVGLFSETLPGYVASLPPPEELPVKLINVDCDLYQGTVEILQYLSDRIGPGSVLIFDEYLMTPTWPDDEYKAFQEACVKFGWEYEYLGFSLFSKQVSVRITSSTSFVGPKADGF